MNLLAMGGLSCEIAMLIRFGLQIYLIALVLYALVSWLPSLRGQWSDRLAQIVEPVLVPMRRVIPIVGGLDLSFFLLFLIVQWLSNIIMRAGCFLY